MTDTIAVGYYGYTAEKFDTANEYVGYVTTFEIRTEHGTHVGWVKVTEGTTVTVAAKLVDGTTVTNNWLDLFNDDAGDRDMTTGLDRAANAIFEATGRNAVTA